jgi:prepilin-type processing-associated H-X9-DG protein
MFWGNSYLGFSDAIDGLSNTILAGERAYYNNAAAWAGAGRNDSYGPEGTLRTLFRGTFKINYDYVKIDPSNVGKGLSSEHPGGVNVVLGDGSVRFVPETVDMSNVMPALVYRADGKPVALP